VRKRRSPGLRRNTKQVRSMPPGSVRAAETLVQVCQPPVTGTVVEVSQAQLGRRMVIARKDCGVADDGASTGRPWQAQPSSSYMRER
jgi:hypothetical protein